MTFHEWFTALYYFHPTHAALILADLVLAAIIGILLVRSYRKMKAQFTVLLLLVVGLMVVAEFLDVAEHFIGIHPARMVPQTAALGLLLYLLKK